MERNILVMRIWVGVACLSATLLAGGCGDSRRARERELLSMAEDTLSANFVDLAQVWEMHHALVRHTTEAHSMVSPQAYVDSNRIRHSRDQVAKILDRQCRTLDRLLKRSSVVTADNSFSDPAIGSDYVATYVRLQSQQWTDLVLP
jgi:hypothetical protein